jgi:hypothetical protein
MCRVKYVVESTDDIGLLSIGLTHVLSEIAKEVPPPGTGIIVLMPSLDSGNFCNQTKTTQNEMKSKLIGAACLAAAVAVQVANACPITVVVACPNGNLACGVKVCLYDCAGNPIGSGTTVNGTVIIPTDVPPCANGMFPYTITACVDVTTLPAGASLANGNNNNCQPVVVPSDLGNSTTFDLTGDFCTPPPPGTSECWETGGGTLDKSKGNVVWTFGGVIYPGCSSAAAGGGNLNIVNHVTGLHFKGTDFIVDDCRGVSTKSPKVTVNIIDWHGVGYVSGDDEGKKVAVTFNGTFRDAKESGANADGLFIQVFDGGNNLVFQIGGGPDDLDLLTTGNVQIHQSSCGKGKP